MSLQVNAAQLFFSLMFDMIKPGKRPFSYELEVLIMSMEVILRKKRKSLGLTQDRSQIISGNDTAVNKWEKGITCLIFLCCPPLRAF
jgi:hypothetical protein